MSTPSIESAVDKIQDALRYVSICAAALDSDRADMSMDARQTLEREATIALYDALQHLGFHPSGKRISAETKDGGVA